MTEAQKSAIKSMREYGFGYARIAKRLGMSVNTVRSYCRRNHLMSEDIQPVVPVEPGARKCFCKGCGVPVAQNPGRKAKLFCSDSCRTMWWNSHPELVNRKAYYNFTCKYCKKPFTAYGNSKRKYCSRACALADRYKV